MEHRYWLHFDLAESVAHVIAMAPVLPEESSTDPALVTGFSFTDVGQFPQDFIGEVLEISSGDADGLIMIREDRGEMVLWERMTRVEGESEASYYAEIASRSLARLVKLADIADNACEDRLALLDERTADRLRKKYARAREELTFGQGQDGADHV